MSDTTPAESEVSGAAVSGATVSGAAAEDAVLAGAAPEDAVLAETATAETATIDSALTDPASIDSAFIDPASIDPAPSNAMPSGVAAAESDNAPVRAAARPRIRWGAIVWGLIVCGIVAATLQITRAAESREGFALWLTQLNPGGIWLIVVLVAGGILLLLGLLAVIRRAQRSR